MSMWLSGANAVANQARGHAAAAVAKQASTLTKQATRTWVDAWLAAAKPKRRH